MNAAELHARIGNTWPQLLARLGVPEEHLRRKHGPCPACGGKDRFRFTNHQGRGGYFCNGCGSGDGFGLLTLVHGWTFSRARREVIEALGLSIPRYDRPGDAHAGNTLSRHGFSPIAPPRSCGTRPDASGIASPTRRVTDLRRNSCDVANCDDAVRYLDSRALWPLPDVSGLRAHAGAEYFSDGNRIGRFPALLADVRDVTGELVTVHVTYLSGGRKLSPHEPRKLLSPLTGRKGCAVRLIPLAADVLGIAEGIETALAAHAIHRIPVWAALNTSLLAKFEPPREIRHVVIFADRDVPGLEAAIALQAHLDGTCTTEVQTPQSPSKDWADALAQDPAKATKGDRHESRFQSNFPATGAHP